MTRPSHFVSLNTINLRYADDTTLMTESEEDLKSLLMKVKEETEKVGLTDLSDGEYNSATCVHTHLLDSSIFHKVFS